jgi:hypothetical protein
MANKPTFFDFAAEVGLTKHFGGIGATAELASLCHIGADGYVLDVGCGANEATWLKVPPPPELLAWVRQDAGATVEPLTSDAWAALLEGAGLSGIAVQMHTVEAANEAKEVARRYGRGGVLRASLRMLSLYLRSPAYRAFVKEVRQGGITPPGLNEYFGYGTYVGRK